MASEKRERLFEDYRNRMRLANSDFKKATLGIILISLGPWLVMTIIFFFKGLALLAGSGMVLGQMLMNYATGRNDELPLQYEVPYLLMLYLFVVGVLTLIMRGFKVRWIKHFLTVVFIGTFIYGIITIWQGSLKLYYSILLMAGALAGFWCCDIVGRCFKEWKFLSAQEGYPDFIDLVGEPVPIANTRGVYMRQYEILKEESRKRTEVKLKNGDSDSCVDINDHLIRGGTGDLPADAMDELTTDFNGSIDELLKNAK